MTSLWLGLYTLVTLAGWGFLVRARRQLRRRERELSRENATVRAMGEFLNELIEAMPHGVLIVAANGDIERMNGAARKLLGLENSVQSRRSLSTVQFLTQTGLVGYLQAALDGQELKLDGYPIRGIASSVTHLNVMTRPFTAQVDAEATPGGFTLVAMADVTELKRLESQTLAMHESLVQAEKLAAVGKLAAGIVHELNNPLTAITASVQYVRLLAQRDPALDVVTEKVAFIETNASRIEKLSRDLLAYVRPAAQHKQTLDVEKVVRQTLAFVDHLARERNVVIQTDIRGPIAPFVGSASDIEHCLVNLVTNALHALEGRAEARVDVAVWQESLGAGRFQLCIRIADNGPGILPDVVAHIWEPFYTTKQDGKGTGLGLPIVAAAVERMNGRIAVETEPGRGTQFLLTLPYSAIL